MQPISSSAWFRRAQNGSRMSCQQRTPIPLASDEAAPLKNGWSRYVKTAGGPIPTRHWDAVETLLSCRTSYAQGKNDRALQRAQGHFI